ncbi:MAG TPA: TlyA family RNA methyltransferase [Bryobacterales bacterium]|nr:TlyA family RNA methyltransferase [Bryobacterales bacterium]
MTPRTRLDSLLVERGLVESREKAQALILAGEVLADGQKVTKAGQKISPQAQIRLLGRKLRFVGRGGEKLEAAMERFAIDVRAKVCLDVGASTGGFTDCLLQRGARKVYAVDAGRAQLHWNIRQDPRVVVCEKVNARYLSADTVPEKIEFVCCDVSFISVTLILPALIPLMTPAASMVVLVKPQFEVGKGEVGKGGIVRDPVLHEKAIDKLRCALEELGFHSLQTMDSPILGAEGNKEFLIYAAQRG